MIAKKDQKNQWFWCAAHFSSPKMHYAIGNSIFDLLEILPSLPVFH